MEQISIQLNFRWFHNSACDQTNRCKSTVIKRNSYRIILDHVVRVYVNYWSCLVLLPEQCKINTKFDLCAAIWYSALLWCVKCWCSKERNLGLPLLWDRDCSIWRPRQDSLQLKKSRKCLPLWILQLDPLMHFVCSYYALIRFRKPCSLFIHFFISLKLHLHLND